MIQEVVLVALTSTEEVTYILDYKESMLIDLEELPPSLPQPEKSQVDDFHRPFLAQLGPWERTDINRPH